jgi:hypothetical protein
VLRSAKYPVQWIVDETDDDDICCGMAVKRMGMLRVRMRKMKALTVKMEKVTLIDMGGWNLTCFVY